MATFEQLDMLTGDYGVRVRSERLTDGSHVYDVALTNGEGGDLVIFPAVDAAAAEAFTEGFLELVRKHTLTSMRRV